MFKTLASATIGIILCCTGSWANPAAIEPSGRVLFAGMEQTRNAVVYGAGTEGEAAGCSGSEREQMGMQNKRGYIEYHAGPSQGQMEARKEEERAKEAASMNMLPYLYLDLRPEPPFGPCRDER